MKRRNAGNSLVPIGIGIVVIMVIILIVSIVIKQRGGSGGLGGGKTLDQLYDKVKVTEATPRKGQVTFESNNLYDELPEIDKYPLAVTGKGSVDIEIFTSGEKAGKDNDSWLIDVANKFNGENHTLSNGMSVSMSVRSVASGTAADYIISGKYVPDLYTPSNTLFG